MAAREDTMQKQWRLAAHVQLAEGAELPVKLTVLRNRRRQDHPTARAEARNLAPELDACVVTVHVHIGRVLKQSLRHRHVCSTCRALNAV